MFSTLRNKAVFWGEERMIELIPYGCTTLRITEFPCKGGDSVMTENVFLQSIGGPVRKWLMEHWLKN